MKPLFHTVGMEYQVKVLNHIRDETEIGRENIYLQIHHTEANAVK
jgi:hypothetical protein